jgi:hypothetical protein
VSRGPGQIMRKVLVFVVAASVDEDRTFMLSYEALASAIYETNAPSSTQVSAVGRATRQLERDGFVEIYAWEDDLRRRFVGVSPWLGPAMEINKVAQIGRGTSPLGDLKLAIATLKQLVEDGLVEFTVDDVPVHPRMRRLSVDGRPPTPDGL